MLEAGVIDLFESLVGNAYVFLTVSVRVSVCAGEWPAGAGGGRAGLPGEPLCCAAPGGGAGRPGEAGGAGETLVTTTSTVAVAGLGHEGQK